jgi:DNA-binding NarL/FixJ family response regulator
MTEPDLWFSSKRSDKAEAEAACLSCPLMRDCREYGKSQEFGIWGGVESTVNEGPSASKLDAAARNLRVIALTSEGLTAPVIAERLGITERTVKRARAAARLAA